MTVVLDAWAIVAYLKDEPAAGQVESAIDAGDALVSEINLGEVLYSVTRSHGEKTARELVEGCRRRVACERPDWELTTAAARLKAKQAISYADAFAVATAARHKASLLTGDPEILGLESDLDVVDLRQPPAAEDASARPSS